jgi:hypothetical protein
MMPQPVLTLNDGSLELYRDKNCELGQKLADFLQANGLPFRDLEEFTLHGIGHTSPSICWLWEDAENWVEKNSFEKMSEEIVHLLTLED